MSDPDRSGEGTAEERLRATQALMRAVLDLTDASVFAKDVEGRYLLVNPRGAEIVGMTPEQIVGRTDAELYDPDSAERFRQHDLEVMRTRRPNTTLMPLPRPDGDEVWLSHLVPLVDDEGHVYGTAGIATDITERHRREQLLHERTRQLELAQRIARLGTWRWDPATGAVEISDELAVLLGGRPGEHWDVARLEAITHPDDLAGAIGAVQQARRGHTVDHTFRIRLDGGEERWLRLRADAADGPDVVGPAPVLGTIQDVTEHEVAASERLALERRLQQAQRLETVGQLAGGVAHDFNNLLSVMEMQVQLALDALTSTGDAGAAPALDQLGDLQGTIRQAADLTRQLLEFSRHDDHAPETADVPAVLERLRPLLSRTVGDAGRLVVEIDDAVPLVPMGGADLERVLVNLVVNARDAMPAGGTVTIRVTGSVPGRPRSVGISIADSGVGMSADVAARAVEPFFSTKPPGSGTGLGLASVHGLVSRAGGELVIDSEPGRGTRVDIVLPHGDPDRTSPSAATDEPVDGPVGAPDPDAGTPQVGPPRRATGDGARAESSAVPTVSTILVVEDLEPLGRLAAAVLGRAGYRTVRASDGHEALARAEEVPVDLLLTDVVMPGMSGRDLADRLRARRPELPVLFMTGYSAGMLDAMHDVPGTDVLPKPFVAGDLVAAVRRLLGQTGEAGSVGDAGAVAPPGHEDRGSGTVAT